MKKILSYLSENKFVLFVVQMTISGIALSVLAWDTVSFVREKLVQHMKLQVNAWVYIFYHPFDSNLFNYIFLCAILGCWGLFIYAAGTKKTVEYLKNKTKNKSINTLLVVLTISLIGLLSLSWCPQSARIVLSLAIVCSPLVYLMNSKNRNVGVFLSIYPWLLFAVLAIEPINNAVGPVYLMNEYDHLYSETILDGKTVKNEVFLGSLSSLDIDTVKMFYDQKNKLEGKSSDEAKGDDIDFLFKLRFKNLDPLQSYMILNHFATMSSTTVEKQVEGERASKQLQLRLNNLRNINVESIKKFYLYNYWEYNHLNMSRGQVNHIGQILNPINEYEEGKPLKDIYLQYGLGNTFVLKWTMDVFGGPSIENFYKCHLYYVVYFLLFLLMLIYLFRDTVYTAGAFTVVALSYFFSKYIGLTLGAGIIPTIHFFDVVVIALLALFFRKKHLIYLLFAFFVVFLSVVINRQFGMMMALSLVISIILYILENRSGRAKYFWVAGVALSFIISISLAHFAYSGAQGTVLNYFLLGFFSWPANSIIIVSTIGYLVTSYFFLFLLRDHKDYLKYIYVLVFFYAQGLLLYYYWSGLPNHLPMALPFVGLQLFLMLFIAEKKFSLLQSYNRTSILKMTVLFILFAVLLLSIYQFYKDKKMFHDNFVNHKVYQWSFTKAHTISTMNPEPLAESIRLIHKYSNSGSGIYMLSEFDNLLPFLAERYNALTFDLAWHLLSDEEVDATINKINKNAPRYLYVDNNIDSEMSDPWSKIYNGDWMKSERASRIGRYYGLQKMFSAISSCYELREKSELLAVYERKQ